MPPPSDHDRLSRLPHATLVALAAVGAATMIGRFLFGRSRRARRAEEALQHAYDDLEVRVARRTAELQDANERLKAAVADREILLREVQHRVKNNLQVICSLLRLQSARLDDRARHGLDESLRRIQGMSLLHELLYRAEQPGRIDLAEYLRALCDQLARANGPAPVRVHVDAASWSLDADQVTPLALIAGELVSNALNHAFPDGRTGEIHVTLQPDDAGMRLRVRDDGIGLPADQPFPDTRRRRGLGLVLVQTLTRQAGAEIVLERTGGTAFTLTIPGHNGREAA